MLYNLLTIRMNMDNYAVIIIELSQKNLFLKFSSYFDVISKIICDRIHLASTMSTIT